MARRRPAGYSPLSLLRDLACIQVDPLDRIGVNAELVAAARLRDYREGDLFDALYPGHGFEHFAKERCLLPPEAFPYYRDQAAETPWWRLSERLKRLDEGLIGAVYDEVQERGPLTAKDLSERGRVEPIDWSGWKGTSRAAKMALEVLWTRCKVVVSGRDRREKVYDVPERALADVALLEVDESFARWSLRERARAAGLLAVASGPWWSMLADVRQSPLVDELVDEGELERVTVAGSKRSYLAARGWRDRFGSETCDDAMRIVAPLDPLIWDRKLIAHVFGFEYVWEVYKPANQRRWGYYTCPLLHHGHFVGRFEGVRERDAIRVLSLWREDGIDFDEAAFDAAIATHAKGFCRARPPLAQSPSGS